MDEQQINQADEIARLKRIVAVLAAQHYGLAMGADPEFKAVSHAVGAEAQALLADVKASGA
jgi:hypothetical protein